MFRFESSKSKFKNSKVIFPIILAFLLLGGGLIWASSRIDGSNEISFTKKVKIDSNENSNNWEKEVIAADANSKDFNDKLKRLGNLDNNDTQSNQNLNFDTKNLTDQLAIATAKQTFNGAKNENDLKNNLSNLSSGEVLQNLSDMNMDNLGSIVSVQNIKDADLKIVPDSADSKKEYWKNFNKIMTDDFKNVNDVNFESLLNNLTDPSSKDRLKQLAQSYNNAASDLKNVATPKSFLDLQKEKIRLLLAFANNSEKLSNAGDDPLSAALAIKTLQNTVQQSSDLQTKLEDAYNNL